MPVPRPSSRATCRATRPCTYGYTSRSGARRMRASGRIGRPAGRAGRRRARRLATAHSRTLERERDADLGMHRPDLGRRGGVRRVACRRLRRRRSSVASRSTRFLPGFQPWYVFGFHGSVPALHFWVDAFGPPGHTWGGSGGLRVSGLSATCERRMKAPAIRTLAAPPGSIASAPPATLRVKRGGGDAPGCPSAARSMSRVVSVDIPPGSVGSLDSIDRNARSLDASLGEPPIPRSCGKSFHLIPDAQSAHLIGRPGLPASRPGAGSVGWERCGDRQPP
jgi:hypothetical protein